MAERNITETEETLGAALRLPFQVLARRLYAELARSGHPDIREAHGPVFRHILPTGSRATELAEQAGMTKQSMAYLVDSLRAAGYVEVIPDPDDGRAKLVRLTPRGEAVQRAAVNISRRLEAEIGDRIGLQGLTELRRLLREAHIALEEGETRLP